MTLLPTSSLTSRSYIPSPLTTQLPNLSASQIASLPYRPDHFPGARDVKTSYGSMRVYEWGEEKGRKIMLVHGDATSSPLWTGVAARLVKRGCRLIVFDLWGRGYTDSPNVVHDTRLFGLQLLFAASSSPLPWCTETFSIVGCSGGGGIAMDFVASFSHLVRNVAILAPAGLLRDLPGSYKTLRTAAQEGKPEEELRRLLGALLDVENEDTSLARKGHEPDVKPSKTGVDSVALQHWQFYYHQGHAASFISTLQHGPIQGQHETWKDACNVLRAKQRANEANGIKERFVAICGREDWVVPSEHVREDLDGMMGKDEYVFKVVPGGHSFLLDEAACEQVVDVLAKEWQL
ncbi:hypothetical protein LTR56_016128 [Elasticomyces elasticus]|nr:hypothetical protein LTR22_026064 [Elasticomyces elasticus]KAK3632805.1 hypothetical protein LTR56_016128 [Elasticomyces elasticus]KAK4918317.1 hypothetical protein LTR49_013867 [Elasticomyces elasticus]KAK5762733.1 hypothetical protein LTS12_007122 [Elasticomyces elasticus]